MERMTGTEQLNIHFLTRKLNLHLISSSSHTNRELTRMTHFIYHISQYSHKNVAHMAFLHCIFIYYKTSFISFWQKGSEFYYEEKTGSSTDIKRTFSYQWNNMLNKTFIPFVTLSLAAGAVNYQLFLRFSWWHWY